MQRIFNLMAFASFIVTGTFVGILFFSIYQLDRWEKEAVERLGAGVKPDIQKQLDKKLKPPINGTPGASLY